DPTRMLIRGSVRQRIILDFLLSDCCSRVQDDEGGRLVSLDFVSDGDDAGLLDRRMPLQHFLNLARVDVFAAAYKHVIRTSQKEVETLSISPENVASYVVPVWCHYLSRGFRQLVIAIHQGRALNAQHTFLGSHVPAGN